MIFVLGLAGAAQATHWVTFDGEGDCAGWSITGVTLLGTGLQSMDMDWQVDLIQDGQVVQSQSGLATVLRDVPVQMSGEWTGDLCGEYTVNGSFHLLAAPDDADNLAAFVATFVCDCPPDEDVCHYTPGYWKNHPENWPLTTLTLGGVEYGQDELLAILRAPVRGDATVILAHHLIAAKLNVANGADDSIQDAIDDADAWLGEHALFSRPVDTAAGLAIKDLLCAYNEIGCDGVFSVVKSVADDLTMDKAATENSTWGAIRKSYR